MKDELHDLFLVAEVLRFVIRWTQITLFRHQRADMVAQQSRHGPPLPIGLAAQPFVLIVSQLYRHRMRSRQRTSPHFRFEKEFTIDARFPAQAGLKSSLGEI